MADMLERRGYDAETLRKKDEKCYPSVVDRYYRKLYNIDMKGQEGEDYCILLHSNRICIITLAPSHPIITEKKTVTKVDFQINKRTNRLQNPLSGKRKRGAQQLVEDSALCIVQCSDGSTYHPCGCLKGSLIEANENLLTKPSLLSSKPETEGYIAIVLTRLQDHKQEINKLLSPEQYHEKLRERARRNHPTDSAPLPPANTIQTASDSDRADETDLTNGSHVSQEDGLVAPADKRSLTVNDEVMNASQSDGSRKLDRCDGDQVIDTAADLNS